LASPWSARRVPNVENLDRIIADGVKNLVRILNNDLYPHVCIIGLFCSERTFLYECDGQMN
jgi:hypothetical protein